MTAQQRAQEALTNALRSYLPEAVLDPERRVSRLEQNVISPITVGQLQAVTAQIERGAGGELRPQSRRGGERPRYRPPMHSPWSSATLAVNVFGGFIGREDKLQLAGRLGFESLSFEEKCPVWKSSVTAPNLDVIARHRSGEIVAIESKCIEPFSMKLAKLDAKYESMKGTMHRTWRARYNEIVREVERPIRRRSFRQLDAAQLLKHYLGLTRTFDAQVRLMYVFWEPLNASDETVCIDHRREIDRFRDGLADPRCSFDAMSYDELWCRWAPGPGNDIDQLLAHLRRRYAVTI